jgi:hypothetical protein
VLLNCPALRDHLLEVRLAEKDALVTLSDHESVTLKPATEGARRDARAMSRRSERHVGLGVHAASAFGKYPCLLRNSTILRRVVRCGTALPRSILDNPDWLMCNAFAALASEIFRLARHSVSIAITSSALAFSGMPGSLRHARNPCQELSALSILRRQ